MPGQNYYESPSAQSSVLFVPFTIAPSESWAHSVTFLNFFDRQTEKRFRESLSALDANIRKKLRERPEGEKGAVVAERDLVQPFFELFKQLFIWQPGEYVAELVVDAEPGSASFSKKYRFTLYESDTADLTAQLEDYPFGGGLTYKVESHLGVNVPLTEHAG